MSYLLGFLFSKKEIKCSYGDLSVETVSLPLSVQSVNLPRNLSDDLWLIVGF